ncbi:MAG: hypothetical protein ACTSRU_12180 [Candidatus Hodarchaeales archaeon]
MQKGSEGRIAGENTKSIALPSVLKKLNGKKPLPINSGQKPCVEVSTRWRETTLSSKRK